MPTLHDPEDQAFRDEVRRFLDRALTPELRLAGRRTATFIAEYEIGSVWFRILAQQGWSVPHWPVDWGGTGWTPRQHDIFASELAAADAPALAPQGPRMVAPVVLAFGTPAQKAQWLPGIRSGDDYWAQGYSEPGAGSDLAALQCRAVRGVDADGEHFIVNGTKIWTTHAHCANRIFCLVRTDLAAKAQQGISFLLFDLALPGITIHPIISLAGDHELNQVFFDNVRVPASALLGEENRGWTIAKYLLEHERGGSFAPMLRGKLKRIREGFARAFAGLPDDDAERRQLAWRIAEAQCRIDALHALEQEVLAARIRGEPNGVSPSIGKVLGTELKQHLNELALAVWGAASAGRLPMAEAGAHALAFPEDAIHAMSAHLNDRAASIYGGSNEVQRNLIARHLLSH